MATHSSILVFWPGEFHGLYSHQGLDMTERLSLHFVSIESVMPFNRLILCSFLFLPPIFPSIRVFSNELAHQVAKVLELQLIISPSSQYSELISFRIDWFDLLAVQGTLKSLLQHHSLKASVLQCSAFVIVQLSHLYITIYIIIYINLREKKLLFPFLFYH